VLVGTLRPVRFVLARLAREESVDAYIRDEFRKQA